MEIYRHRGKLRQTRHALDAGKITIGFIGGSITDPRPGWNWPEPVCAWFVENYPNVCVQVENAAIGATGSDLAVFRAERDLIERGCDLVFVEYAVNDEGVASERRFHSREGLLRKLLRGEGCDIVLTYTYSQGMHADMIQGTVPPSIAEFEQLAGHYQIGSVWMGLHALREVQKGRMRWEEWLPDGLHPNLRGSFSYAQSVIGFLEKELLTNASEIDILCGQKLPAALHARNWENTRLISLAEIERQGPWSIHRWPHSASIDQVLYTAAPGARLKFGFEGRGLVLGMDFGKASAEYRYRLDGGRWCRSGLDRPDWVGAGGWYRLSLIADDLNTGQHTFELETMHGNPSGDGSRASYYTGTNFKLALVGVIG
ncbi:MAG: SGNH/GDSL hydrolase family protein [Chloroflexota bacterium]